MKIFPMDVQRQSFRRVLRGYDREEVRTYLNIVAQEMEDLQRAHASLEQEVQTLRDLVEEMQLDPRRRRRPNRQHRHSAWITPVLQYGDRSGGSTVGDGGLHAHDVFERLRPRFTPTGKEAAISDLRSERVGSEYFRDLGDCEALLPQPSVQCEEPLGVLFGRVVDTCGDELLDGCHHTEST